MPILLLALLAASVVFLVMRRPFSYWPVETPIVTSAFGARVHPVTGAPSFHNGTDFKAATGAPLLSIGAGVVVDVGADARSGTFVRVEGRGEHAGWSWSYSHLSAVLVSRGDELEAGAKVGEAGATGRVTGPHLHFVMRRRGELVDPMTVLPFLGSDQGTDEERHA